MTKNAIDDALSALRGPVTKNYTAARRAYWNAVRDEGAAEREMKKKFRPLAKLVKAYIRKRLGRRYPIVNYHEPGFSLDHSKNPVDRFPSVSFRMHLDNAGYGHRIAIEASHCPADCADLDRWLDHIIAI